MKRRIGLALTALAVTALSPTPAPTEDIAERSLLDNDRVAVVEYTLPPGFRGEEHAAIANELAYVIDGEFSVVTAGEGKRTVRKGEIAYASKDTRHYSLNETTRPAKILVVLLKDH